MTVLPRSLSGRLLAMSALTTLVALALAAVGIGRVLERFVIQGLDQQLDAEISMLTRALRPDGTLDMARVVDLPVFATLGGGWGWRVEGPDGRWYGGDRIEQGARPRPGTHLRPGPDPQPRLDPGPPLHGPQPTGAAPPPAIPGEGVTDAGVAVHTRRAIVPTRAGAVVVTVGGPRRLATAPLREAMLPLLASLALLGVMLALATLVQLRVGLRPLRDLQGALADVRAGRARHVPVDQPNEIAPLAAELNALVDQNAAQLAHARGHVANLAHGLKTPLAALALRLAESGRDPGGDLGAMVADIDGRIRHHLGRARAAAPGGRPSGHAMLAPTVVDLVAVMQGIHADRGITVTADVAPGLAVAADPQDVEEMLGNLFDNAWRHARSTVAIAAARVGPDVEMRVEDDGPGLPPASIAEALQPGRRLDERGDGHGFGLPIAQELAELNGGQLTLSPSVSMGGLRATLSLPASVAAARD